MVRAGLMLCVVLRVPAGLPELGDYLALVHSPAAAHMCRSDTDQDSFSGSHTPTIGMRECWLPTRGTCGWWRHRSHAKCARLRASSSAPQASGSLPGELPGYE